MDQLHHPQVTEGELGTELELCDLPKVTHRDGGRARNPSLDATLEHASSYQHEESL